MNRLDNFSKNKYTFTEYEIMDKLAICILESLDDTESFSLKGGWVLNKIFPNDFRRTIDVDMSISEVGIFDTVKDYLEELCEMLMSSGEIYNYKFIYPKVELKRSGGVKLYRLTSNGRKYKVSGVDISVKNLDRGVCLLNSSIPVFTFERMLSDKIKVLLSPSVLRRTKDIFDTRLIFDRVSVDTNELIELCKMNDVTLNKENFISLSDSKELMESWDKFLDIDKIIVYRDLLDNINYIKNKLLSIGLIK